MIRIADSLDLKSLAVGNLSSPTKRDKDPKIWPRGWSKSYWVSRRASPKHEAQPSSCDSKSADNSSLHILFERFLQQAASPLARNWRCNTVQDISRTKEETLKMAVAGLDR